WPSPADVRSGAKTPAARDTRARGTGRRRGGHGVRSVVACDAPLARRVSLAASGGWRRQRFDGVEQEVARAGVEHAFEGDPTPVRQRHQLLGQIGRADHQEGGLVVRHLVDVRPGVEGVAAEDARVHGTHPAHLLVVLSREAERDACPAGVVRRRLVRDERALHAPDDRALVEDLLGSRREGEQQEGDKKREAGEGAWQGDGGVHDLASHFGIFALAGRTWTPESMKFRDSGTSMPRRTTLFPTCAFWSCDSSPAGPLTSRVGWSGSSRRITSRPSKGSSSQGMNDETLTHRTGVSGWSTIPIRPGNQPVCWAVLRSLATLPCST